MRYVCLVCSDDFWCDEELDLDERICEECHWVAQFVDEDDYSFRSDADLLPP